jgi:phytoene dehydrogenase-like protein
MLTCMENAARRYDAVVVGSGPNGMAAAITLARAGRSVLVVEAQDEPGGGARSANLTLPGFTHDLFSAVHPLAVESPFFQSLPLEQYGLEWIHSPAVVAHPLDGGDAAILRRSVDETAAGLGRDAEAYRRRIAPLLDDWPYFKSEFLRPIRFPRHPWRLAKFGVPALLPARLLAKLAFKDARARALFAGIAAHSTLSLDASGSSSFGLALLLAGHNVGWPMPRGGAGAISQALISYFRAIGGELVTGTPVETMAQLPVARAVLFDVGPGQLARIAASELLPSFSSRLTRFRRAPGVFKLDWALRGPIPWANHDVAQAATVHLGGTLDELAASERCPARGEVSERPYVLLVQPSLFDRTRAPEGNHTAWAYCHVPNGSSVDMTARIEVQVERFAPGFRDLILARHVLSPADLERRNANLVGGDINGGAVNLTQLFLRPTARLYKTPRRDIFICSASTPPGSGVHGLCGYYAANEALSTCLK